LLSYEGPARKGLLVTVIAASMGAAAKIVGALYGSRAVLVDALTSIANMVALAGILAYYKASMKPADLDHPYGHARLKYAGALLALLVYMFVAGLSALEIYYSLSGYNVGPQSWEAALIGGAFYAIAIASARGIDPVLRVYAGLTLSELVESMVSILSSFLGAEISYIIDLLGASAILLYILHEVYKTLNTIVELMSDKAPPKHIYNIIEKEARIRGFRISRLRLRRIDENYYAGDIILEPESDIPLDIASLLADEVRSILLEKGIDVVVSVNIPLRRIKERMELTH
jgi:divalent metal cation (Fe/Co/Zn/Cd) transporter